MLNHKRATTAVAATAVGIEGILVDNLGDETRGAMFVAGLLGAGYCIINDDDCSDAIAKISYYGAQIAYFKNEASKHTDEIVAREQELAEIEKQKAPYLAERASLSSKAQSLQTQIESLMSLCGS